MVPYRQSKRLLDLALAVVALVLSLPVQIATALAVAARLGRPVLFRQTGPDSLGSLGPGEFRTMLPIDASQTGRRRVADDPAGPRAAQHQPR